MTFKFSIKTKTGNGLAAETEFSIEPGTSLLFVGANGGGKTRLAVRIEEALGEKAHRISAHRALTLNPNVPKISEQIALAGLRTGNASESARIGHRPGSRWGSNAATVLLNDYDFLIQSLFAEQANTSLETHKNARAGNNKPASATKLENLVEIWDRLLPTRKLEISGDDIQVYINDPNKRYRATDMSDGERSIFYLIGQTLLAAPDTLIIFDEPELHIHRSIMSRLWDELEAARPDCAMVFISHDLDFVASREGQKYVLRDYDPDEGWTIEKVPEDTGFSEEITTLILGSRKPILFVEGRGGSLDKSIYRACYPTWTVIPRGSCEEVIHAVVTLRANATLTRVTCSGIVDADAFSEAEADFLKRKGIEILPVSEIENIFLLPDIATSIARAEGFDGEALFSKIEALKNELKELASNEENQNDVVTRYCRRRIDRTLKKIDLSDASDIEAIAKAYAERTAALDVKSIGDLARKRLQDAIANDDIENLLKWFDNKGLLAIAAKLKGTPKAQFEQWLTRTLRNKSVSIVSEAIMKVLPAIKPS